MKYLYSLVVTLVYFFAWQNPVWAHGVYIFAWVEGEQICTESYFNKGSKVKNGTVNMLAPQGELLYTAQSNQFGLACFPFPDTAQELNFEVLAGDGHKATFNLPASTLAGYEANNANQAQNNSELEQEKQAPPATATRNQTDFVFSKDTMRQLIQQELQKQLGPVHKSITELKQNDHLRLKDIIGGIGWIIGLAGFASWICQRQKQKKGKK